MEDFKTSDIRHLVNLLNLEEDENSDDSDSYPIRSSNPYSAVSNTTPANSVDKKLIEMSENPYGYTRSAISKDIWSDDEILSENYDEAQIKEKPLYEIVYQQKVTPDDIFLQLDGKGPGTNSCECLLVKIQLRGTNSKDDISLKISSLSLICKTDKYYLDLDFPRHVDPSKCFSTWNQSICMLTVKLFFGEENGLHF